MNRQFVGKFALAPDAAPPDRDISPGIRRMPEPETQDQEYRPVPLSALRDFLAAIGFEPTDMDRVIKIRADARIVQVTMLRRNESGKYFIDQNTGRPAEEHFVMPVVVP